MKNLDISNIGSKKLKDPEDNWKRINEIIEQLNISFQELIDLGEGSGYLSYAKKEFDLAWPNWKENEWQSMICNDIIESLLILSLQGHSGHSFSYFFNIFKKLANFEPITSLTFKDDEFSETSYGDDNSRQNKRLSSLFKTNEGFHYIYAITWYGKYEYLPELNKFSAPNIYNTFTGCGPIIIDSEGNILGRYKTGNIKDISTWDKNKHFTCEVYTMRDENGCEDICFVDSPMLKEYEKVYTHEIEPISNLDDYLKESNGLLRKAIKLAVECRKNNNLEKMCISDEEV